MCAAWIAPSAANAIFTAACSWRDCPAARRFSRRSSDPLERRADLRRREHHAHLVALHHHLLPEAAAGVAHDDADAVLGDTEQAGAEQPHFVRRLRRRVDREVAGRARVVDDERAPFHRHRGVRLLEDGSHPPRARPLRRRRRARPTGSPLITPTTLEPWARVHERVGVLGLRVVDDRRERLVVDVDQLGRVLGDVAVLGDDQRDGIADEADLAVGERRARRLGARRADRRVPLLLDSGVQVGGGEHEADPGQRARGRRVDRRGSPPRRTGCARRTRAACPGSEMSSTNVPVPGEQARVLDAVDARARRSGRHR